MISVVTSCSLKGWAEYGQHFVRTFKQYWPHHVQLYVVSEDLLPSVRGVVYLPLDDHAECRDFLQRHADHRWAAGETKSGYNYLLDAYKFSKKVYAIELAADTINGGKLFWFDADVITFASVSDQFMQQMLPDEAAISCLLRPTVYTETGFVGYNLDHGDTRRFIVRCAEFYSSDKVFDLEQWHDCWVFDRVREQMNIKIFSIPHKSNGHPFINSMLGQCFDHLKGPRKQRGRSGVREQLVHRNLDYWRA